MSTISSASRRRFVPLGLAAALVGSVLLAAPVGAAQPATSSPGAAATQPAAAKTFRVNLYKRGDFVSQTNTVQCVGTSMQMMINMMRSKDNRTASWQLELQQLARRYSARNWDGTEANGQVRNRRGASVRGWAFGLTKLGFGRFRVTAGATLDEAIHMAAVAMLRTGRPVGLLMWRGRHAWVMSGFEATGNPLTDPAATITHVYVQDPLYPRTSSVWGKSPAPNTKLSLKQLGTEFLPRRSNMGSTGGRYTIVMPWVQLRSVDRRVNGHD